MGEKREGGDWGVSWNSHKQAIRVDVAKALIDLLLVSLLLLPLLLLLLLFVTVIAVIWQLVIMLATSCCQKLVI